MKIAFCHFNLPKSITQEFVKKWPMYEYVEIENSVEEPETIEDYGNFLFDTQRVLTGKLCDKMQEGALKTNVVYNNTMLNILSDSIIAVDAGIIKNTEFLANQFIITQNMFKLLDIIFWLNDESETDDNWELATRQLFKQYNKDSWDQSGLIFPLTDRPAFIEINYNPKHPKSVIRTIEEYLDKNGQIFEPDNDYLAQQFSEMQKTISPNDLKQALLGE